MNLADLDLFSKSDPVCVVYEFEFENGGMWRMLDKTETIDDELNPVFTKPLEFPVTSRAQRMKFAMYDYDGGNDYELIGLKECTV